MIVEQNQKLKSTTDMLSGADAAKGQGGSSSVTGTVETITTTSDLHSATGGAGSAATGAGSAGASESSESWSTQEVDTCSQHASPYA